MTEAETLQIRPSRPDDLEALDVLFSESYPRLLKNDYPPSVVVTAVPLICKAQPALLKSGSYFVAEEAGRIVGAGGWTVQAPGGKPGTRGVGHVRHVVSDHRLQRRGIGRQIMRYTMAHALGSGMMQLHCQSTRTAVRFYTAMGFAARGDIEVPLRPGITFPAVFMVAQL